MTVTGSSLWYASRATGVVSLLLLCLIVALGALVRAKGKIPGLPRFAGVTLHRSVSLLTVVFLALHIATALADSYVSIPWMAVVVPFSSTYERLALGLGTVAFDLMIALVVTSLLRTRIGARTWRAIHWAAYACFPAAILHGVSAAKDLRSGPLLAICAAMVALAVGAVAWRSRRAAQLPPAARRGRPRTTSRDGSAAARSGLPTFAQRHDLIGARR